MENHSHTSPGKEEVCRARGERAVGPVKYSARATTLAPEPPIYFGRCLLQSCLAVKGIHHLQQHNSSAESESRGKVLQKRRKKKKKGHQSPQKTCANYRGLSREHSGYKYKEKLLNGFWDKESALVHKTRCSYCIDPETLHSAASWNSELPPEGKC